MRPLFSTSLRSTPMNNNNNNTTINSNNNRTTTTTSLNTPLRGGGGTHSRVTAAAAAARHTLSNNNHNQQPFMMPPAFIIGERNTNNNNPNNNSTNEHLLLFGSSLSDRENMTSSFSDLIETTQPTQIPFSCGESNGEDVLSSPLVSATIPQLPPPWGRLIPMPIYEGQLISLGITEPWVLRSVEQPCTIGRGSQSMFKIQALTVSSKHCSLSISATGPSSSNNNNGMPFVVDHGSSNGSFVNAQKLEAEKRYFLVHGDILSLVAPAPPPSSSLKSSSSSSSVAAATSRNNNNNDGSLAQQQLQPPPSLLQISSSSIVGGSGVGLLSAATATAPTFNPVNNNNNTKRLRPSSVIPSPSDRIPIQFFFDGGLRPSASALERAGKCSLLQPRYILLDELGKGNFATVYRALNRETGERVAIKIIERARFQNVGLTRWVEQVTKEVETLKKLKHPGIVEFREVLRNDDFVCVVTELLNGGELFDRLIKEGAYTENRAKLVVRRILDAIVYLHDNGIVHRDLKPENIVMVSKDNDIEVKLVDFGVAAEESGGRKTFCGSMSYVAPEILLRRGSIMRRGTYGKSVDMWSFGVIVYIILCGRPPFDEDEDANAMHMHIDQVLQFPGVEWNEISKEAKDFVRKCLEMNESKRITARDAVCHEWLKSM
jgi:tRNA A-37 threonylcarbamoyl transferase component Bud32